MPLLLFIMPFSCGWRRLRIGMALRILLLLSLLVTAPRWLAIRHYYYTTARRYHHILRHLAPLHETFITMSSFTLRHYGIHIETREEDAGRYWRLYFRRCRATQFYHVIECLCLLLLAGCCCVYAAVGLSFYATRRIICRYYFITRRKVDIVVIVSLLYYAHVDTPSPYINAVVTPVILYYTPAAAIAILLSITRITQRALVIFMMLA